MKPHRDSEQEVALGVDTAEALGCVGAGAVARPEEDGEAFGKPAKATALGAAQERGWGAK